jgi:ribosomal protein L20
VARKTPTVAPADIALLASCYRAWLAQAYQGDYSSKPAALERDMVETFIAKRDVRRLAELFVERLAACPRDEPVYVRFLNVLTEEEAALVRRLLAPSRTVVTRVLSRGKIVSDDEYEVLRAYLDSIEADSAHAEERDRIYKILDAYA